ncbi:MAG: ComEC/Rec2 family competence protein [Candidatus Cyclobacteriaceae bacterium M3_2C_046]
MMNYWIKFPFVRFFAAFLLGIGCANIKLAVSKALISQEILLLVLFVVISAYFLFCLISKKTLFYKLQTTIGFLSLLILFLAGFIRHGQHSQHFKNDHLIHQEDYSFYQGKVLGTAYTERSQKLTFEIRGIFQKKWKPASGTILVYFPRDMALKITTGDHLVIRGRPQPIPFPKNPGEFDYKKYLANQNIYQQHFIHEGSQINLYKPANPNNINQWAAYSRNQLEQIIEKFILGLEPQAITKALILGVKEELSAEIKQAYASSGAMHVLAVSGLHVGVIYGILLFLLGGIRNTTWGRWIFAVFSIMLLWFYALITGFSPSVTRAVTMFSFIIISQASRRQTNIYNTIAASAFLLLWFNPFLIESVGFQLSYLAVLGIIYLQPKIYSWFQPESKITDKVWVLTSVSIAAQIATFPLTIFYFHQFPLWALVTNLMVIPAAFLILSAGLLLFLLSPLEILASGLGKLLSLLINTLNQTIIWFDQLPVNKIEDIYWEWQQVLAIFAFMIMLMMFFHYRRFSYLIWATICLGLFTFSTLLKQVQQTHLKEIVFYAVPGSTVVDFMYGESLYSYTDSINYSQDKINYHVSSSRRLKGYKGLNLPPVPLKKQIHGNQLISFNGLTFLFLNNAEITYLNPAKVDYLVICNDAVNELDQVMDLYRFNHLILDGSNSRYLVRKWLIQAETSNISCYAVGQQGARIVHL